MGGGENDVALMATSSYTVNKNCKVSASPATEQSLVSGGLGFDDSNDVIFVCPDLVKVVLVYLYIDGDSEVADTSATLENATNGKRWAMVRTQVEDYNSTNIYVGVTPGKTYKLQCYGDGVGQGGDISWSNDINKHTPSIIDY